MSTVEFRMVGVGARAQFIKERFPFSLAQRGDVIVRSTLNSGASLSDHLVHLWGFLKHERRYLKKIQQEGVGLLCYCTVHKGPVKLQPNAAEMLHLLGAELVVEVK